MVWFHNNRNIVKNPQFNSNSRQNFGNTERLLFVDTFRRIFQLGSYLFLCCYSINFGPHIFIVFTTNKLISPFIFNKRNVVLMANDYRIHRRRSP